MPQQTAVEAAEAAAAADHRYFKHHQQHLYPDMPQPAAGVVAAPGTAAAEHRYMSPANPLGPYIGNAQQQTSEAFAAAAVPVARRLEYPAQFAPTATMDSYEPAVDPGYDGHQAKTVHNPASALPGGQTAYSAVTDIGQALAYDQGSAVAAGDAGGTCGPSAAAAGWPAACAAGCLQAPGMDGGASGYAPTAAAGQSAAHHASGGMAIGAYGQPMLHTPAARGAGHSSYDPNLAAAAAQPRNMYSAAADQPQHAQHNSYTVYPSAPMTAAGANGCRAVGPTSCSDWPQRVTAMTPVGDYSVGGGLSAQPWPTMPAAIHSAQNVVQRPSAFSALPRTRQTTYAATYTPRAGFGKLLQQKMNRLQPFSPHGAVACVPERL